MERKDAYSTNIRGQKMKKSSLIVVMAGLAALAALPSAAFARNRMYDPTLGRFLQRDPLGTLPPTHGKRNVSDPRFRIADSQASIANHTTVALYEYGVSAPTVMVDPYGLTPVKDRAIGFSQAIRDIEEFEQAQAKDSGGQCCCDRLKAIKDKVRAGQTGFGSAGPLSSSGNAAGTVAPGLGWKYFGIGKGTGRTGLLAVLCG